MIRFTLALVFMMVAALVPTAAFAVEAGTAAPALVAVKADGSKLALERDGAKFTYVDFWASWCGPCKQSFPWMNAMQQKYGKDGLRVVAINVDKRKEDADKFLRAHAAQFDIGFDPEGKTPAAYAVKAMPSSFLVDRAGKVVWVHRGFRPEEADAIEREIQTRMKNEK
jgi:cytochrome c biogenesis protein CcmG, thiol:disulfide interchange protein DsbE